MAACCFSCSCPFHLKDTFFSLYRKGGLPNHLQQTYPFPNPNIKGFSYLSDYECHKTPTLQPLPVWKSKVSLWLLLIPYLNSLYSNKRSLGCYAIKNVSLTKSDSLDMSKFRFDCWLACRLSVCRLTTPLLEYIRVIQRSQTLFAKDSTLTFKNFVSHALEKIISQTD